MCWSPAVLVVCKQTWPRETPPYSYSTVVAFTRIAKTTMKCMDSPNLFAPSRFVSCFPVACCFLGCLNVFGVTCSPSVSRPPPSPTLLIEPFSFLLALS